MFNSKENGFSLIELIVVLIITAILAQLGYSAFNRYVRRTRAFAAKTALKNIQRECESNRDLEAPETFTLLPIRGYSIATRDTNSCLGQSSDGKVSLIPDNQNQMPSFFYSYLLGQISCYFKNNQLDYPNCDVSNFGNNIYDQVPNSLNGEEGLLGKIDGLKTVAYGYFFINFQPEKFEVGERMALLRPGGDNGTAESDLKLYLEAVNDTQYKIVVAGSYYDKYPSPFVSTNTYYDFGKPNNIGLRYTSEKVTFRDGEGVESEGPFHGIIRETSYRKLGFDPYEERPTEIGFFQNPKLLNNYINQVHDKYGHLRTPEYTKPIKPYKGQINTIKHYDLTALWKELPATTEDEWLYKNAESNGNKGLLFSTDNIHNLKEVTKVESP